MRPLLIAVALLLVPMGAAAQTYRDDRPVLTSGPLGFMKIAEATVTTSGGPVGVWAAWVHDGGNQRGAGWLTSYAVLLRSYPSQPKGAGAAADSRWLPSTAPGTHAVEPVTWITVDMVPAGTYRYALWVAVQGDADAYLAASVVRLIVWPLGGP